MLLESRLPNFTTEMEAIHLARDVYGLVVSAKSVPGEYDDNFYLTTADERAFVLKVLHPARDFAFVDMQARALEHLAKNLPHRQLPRVIPTNDGKPFTTKSDPNGERRIVWLLSYVDGATLAEVNPHSQELLESVGQLLGEMDSTLAEFDHPAAHRELPWDSARAAWIAGSFDAIENRQQRALLEGFLALYQSEVAPALPAMRRSVIYGDGNDHNVLVSEPWPQPRHAKAVIDFGDMHHGMVVSEPAVAAAYAILGKRDPLLAAQALIAGYYRA